MKIRRALLSVSDKSGLEDLGRALVSAGVELVATGNTAKVLITAGLKVVPIEEVSGSPEAFQGRMKTLSFPVCGGILYRRGDSSDEADLKRLNIKPIDCVVVNFYPFEKAAAREGITRPDLIEEVDIGGPTLVRAAAKNVPQVLVLTDPAQYSGVIADLRAGGEVREETIETCARRAWDRVTEYDQAISQRLGASGQRALRYGENPHQKASLEFDPHGPINWQTELTPSELSYNNILDLSSAYALASDLKSLEPKCTSVVIVKHNNPCGVASIPKTTAGAQILAITKAWEGDPTSAFGGVLVFTDELESEVASWLSERFVELIAAPGLAAKPEILKSMLVRRKNLKAVEIRRFGELPKQSTVAVPGGKLTQTTDTALGEDLRSVTQIAWPDSKKSLSHFGIAVCRSLKSNAIALVRELPGVPGASQLVGAGQGQPNRVEALKALAVPRARSVVGESLKDCVMVSDAFFPFRDTVDTAHESGLRYIIQPGGSLKDSESIAACNEHGISMVFTGLRHFKH